MKFADEVTIICDTRNLDLALSLRSVLEGYDLRPRLLRLFQRRQLLQVFGEGDLPSPWTVLVSHGYRNETGCGIRFELVDNPDPDLHATEGWFKTDVDLTVETVPQIIKNGRGALISVACGAGDESLAAAFLAAGFDAYVAGVENYIDTNSTMLFVYGLFYFLLAGDRTYAPREFGLPEAVEMARAVHPDWQFGTQGFRCFTRETA